MRRPPPQLLVALLLAATAWCFVAALPLGWGAADAPDGTRYKVSPLGVSHVLKPHQTISPTEDCRWSDAAAACRLRAEAPLAASTLRLVPWLLRVAALLTLMGAVAWLLPGRAFRQAGMVAVVLPPALGLLALGMFAWAVPQASVTLGRLPFGVGGTKATLQLAALTSAWLGFTAVALPAHSRRLRWSLAVAGTGLGLLTFLLMFPPLGGAAFAVASLAAGAGLAHLTRPVTVQVTLQGTWRRGRGG